MNHFKHRFREEIICKSVKWIAKTIDVSADESVHQIVFTYIN